MFKQIFYAGLVLALSITCKSKQNYPSPPGYDLNKPQKFIMPQSLDEVSGITFYQGNPDVIYAEQDEEGVLFYLKPGDTRAARCKFAKNGDYEDVAICNDRVILLKSNGNLYTFPFSEVQHEKTDSVTEWKDLLPKGEYEGMYADEQTQALYILCKQCKGEKGKGYILQMGPDGVISLKGEFEVAVPDIKKFHPAALARHPRTAEWYIVSSVNKLLLITDPSWKVKEVYKLNPSQFVQPEGITFDKDGNLYISNEGSELSRGNVLKMAYTSK